MKNSIWVAITFALMCFLRTESVRGQALEDMEQAEIAKALPQSESQEKTSVVSERNSLPIATGVESGNDGLNQASEVIELAQNPGEEKARAETKEGSVLDETVDEWDPWEPFNEKTFQFNRQVDRFVLKPVAKGYNAALPDLVRGGIANMFDNLDVTRRLVNNILQLRFDGAGRELARFVINSTVGVAGLFDVAGHLDITKSDRDTGQTLGIYGIGHGPYLVLPFLPPLTVRDFFGFVADEAMYPLSYFIPIGANIGMTAVETISDRAATIDRYQGVEDTVVDLYSSVRNAYFQRRAADLKK
jgi:ABC-type transporter lipoprotein component MlaA